ncbi:MAG: SDR family oxidoreductase [Armatimonadetes bacterium]|nr:SDR family oxidoreductase [Armatimonadota bacterium]MDW8120727.1 SDR family oxidoreductase [Armatimonadota bacterium]
MKTGKDNWSLKDKVAIVTGGGRGIGQSIAETLSSEGAWVVVADIDEGNARAVARAINESGQQAMAVRCDVRDESQVQFLVQQAVDWGGGVDILINNAAIMRRGFVWSLPSKDFEELIQVNLIGPFYCIKQCAPRMKERGGGVIINISSIHAFGTMEEMSAYATAKTGLIGLTRACAIDLGPWNIRVLAICPGAVDAPMLHGDRPQEQIEVIRSQWARAAPLGCIVTPQEIAQLVAFLCTDKAPSMTGAALLIDAGVAAHLRVRDL